MTRAPLPRTGDDMDLPEGKTCGDCVHVHRCTSMFGHIPEDMACDWSPSRFREALPASDAILSPCGGYRYLLTRRWGAGRALAIVMLNPSTADASVDDPTIRRCMGFARREGFDGIEVANLYAFRATKPGKLALVDDPEGPDNLDHLRRLAIQRRDGGVILCAWGASEHADPGHVRGVTNQLQHYGAALVCLGKTKAGAPRHPLYVHADQALERFA